MAALKVGKYIEKPKTAFQSHNFLDLKTYICFPYSHYPQARTPFKALSCSL